jgi:hypothetical protein
MGTERTRTAELLQQKPVTRGQCFLTFGASSLSQQIILFKEKL